MARRSGFLHAIAQAQRQAERQRVAQVRAQAQARTRAAQTVEKAQKAYLSAQKARLSAQKAHADAQKAAQKESERLYIESRVAEVALQNEQIERDVEQLQNLLTATLSIDDYLDLETLKPALNIPYFNPGPLAVPELPPVQQRYFPPELSGIQKLVPG